MKGDKKIKNSVTGQLLYQWQGTPIAAHGNATLGAWGTDIKNNELYFFTGKGPFYGWEVFRFISVVHNDPTNPTTPPPAYKNNAVIYNLALYLKNEQGEWQRAIPDVSKLISDSLSSINTVVSSLQSDNTITKANLITLQGALSTQNQSISNLQTQQTTNVTLIGALQTGQVNNTNLINSLINIKPIYTNLTSTNSPSIVGTASILIMNTEEIDTNNIHQNGIITMPTAGRIRISGKLQIIITANLAISINTKVNFFIYYRANSTSAWTPKKTLYTHTLTSALALGGSINIQIPITTCELSSIDSGSILLKDTQVALYASQNTGATVIIDPTIGSNYINFEILPS